MSTVQEIVFYVDAKAACVSHNTDAKIVAIKAFERGYWPIYSRLTIEELNRGLYSDDELEAAIVGSMWGWTVPGARPAVQAIKRLERSIAMENLG